MTIGEFIFASVVGIVGVSLIRLIVELLAVGESPGADDGNHGPASAGAVEIQGETGNAKTD